MTPEAAWQATLGELELQMTRAIFNTWLRDAYVVSADQDVYTIGVRNEHAKDWLENRLKDKVQQTLGNILNQDVELRFVIGVNGNRPQSVYEATDSAEASNTSKPKSKSHPEHDTGVLEHYVFSTFVVGHSNRLAHAASLSVAERPGETYNPLFIYGGVGLGKTHLLHAIGNKCMSDGLSVCYVSSETFTNDLIQSIRSQRMADFREKYRTPDLLLIDDIQFVAGKESTQEELFHTFNELHSRGHQVVLSSDRPPKAMVTLEERLKSRFEWGLMADIQLPDVETRLAILQTKAETHNAVVPLDVLELIAHNVRNNIRELEGALNKVIAYSELMDAPITPQLVNMALADLIRSPEKVTVPHVMSAVCKYYNVSMEDIRSKGRSRAIAFPRQVAMYLCRTETDASLPQIGSYMGNRDHTTILYGYEKISEKFDTDPNIRRAILEIRAALYDTSV